MADFSSADDVADLAIGLVSTWLCVFAELDVLWGDFLYLFEIEVDFDEEPCCSSALCVCCAGRSAADLRVVDS